MKAQLIDERPGKQFYKLSEYVKLGKSDLGWADINAALQFQFNRFKLEYKEEMRDTMLSGKGVNIVCISDARDHAERLVFPAYYVPSRKMHSYMCYDIGGTHTQLIDGGDFSTFHKPEYYLQQLAEVNGLKWEGIVESL